MTLICLADRMDNSIRIDEGHISNKQLIELSGLSRDILQKSLKELVQNKFVAIQGTNRNRMLYMNPIIAEDTATESWVHDLFK